jgi:hypothetical protein
MSGGAATSEVSSDAEVSTTVSVVWVVVLSVVVVAVEAHAPNNSAIRITMDIIVSVFFIFFSFV